MWTCISIVLAVDFPIAHGHSKLIFPLKGISMPDRDVLRNATKEHFCHGSSGDRIRWYLCVDVPHQKVWNGGQVPAAILIMASTRVCVNGVCAVYVIRTLYMYMYT